MSLKLFLPLYLMVFFGVVVLWRVYSFKKTMGIDPLLIKHQWLGGLFSYYFVVLFTTLAITTFLFGISSQWYEYLYPIEWLMGSWLIWAGIVLLIFSLGWIVLAQLQMGKYWRIGFAKINDSALIQGGVFSYSRHPIYLGIRLFLLGYLLVLPNLVTLVIFFVGDLILQIQARLEEQHLTQAHGQIYIDYQRHVRRWF